MASSSGSSSSSRKRKWKSPEIPEDGELMAEVPLLTQPSKNKSGPSVSIEEKNQRLKENAIMRHIHDRMNVSDEWRRRYWTPGTEEGKKLLEGKLVELGTAAYNAAAMDQHVYGMEASALEVQKRLLRAEIFRTRARVWEGWFRRAPRLQNSRSLSFAYKACEPMSDNIFRHIQHLGQLTPMGRHRFIGHGVVGNVFLVGCLDPTLAKQLGAHDVVFYVAKRLVTRGTRTGFDEAVKEMSAFPISHPAICRPIGGMLDRETPTLLFPWWNGGHIVKWIGIERELRWRLAPNGLRYVTVPDEVRNRYSTDDQDSADIFRGHRLQMAATLLQGLTFMHSKDWLHCDIHPRNIFVHFPLWDWDDKGKMDVRVDNPSDANARRIKRKLVFVALGDLGWTQKKKDVEKGRFSLDKHEKTTREWVAPELTYPRAPYDAQGNQYVTNFTESSDVFALGWVLKELCGDFFTQMSPRLLALYDESMFAKGFPTSSRTSLPHSFHAAKLKEALDIMTTRNIANRPDIRRTAHYWATFFQEQLMVDPFECQRPIEDKPRAKEHPDGPRELGGDLL
ncbi:hypothetical protein R1sor_024991 [Riccia sorocarpa]|uniref:Protein kinase domain-containing protein n=1 Tax=Riccia sorocarpa TaxID=122646 RepID=A0ABD3G7B3_9MARC